MREINIKMNHFNQARSHAFHASRFSLMPCLAMTQSLVGDLPEALDGQSQKAFSE